MTFLGRILKRVGDSVLFMMKSGYLDAAFEEFGLTRCEGSSTPGSKGVKRPLDGGDLLDNAEHKVYRRVVGRLQWICPVRPDLMYPVKELARNLSAPTVEDKFKVKHVLRYLKKKLSILSFAFDLS